MFSQVAYLKAAVRMKSLFKLTVVTGFFQNIFSVILSRKHSQIYSHFSMRFHSNTSHFQILHFQILPQKIDTDFMRYSL